MTLRVLPDAELLTVLWLQQVDEIVELAAGVFTEIPAEPTLPLVRVLRIGGGSAFRQWFDVPRIQVDVWADDKQAAHDLARVVQAALHDMIGVHDDAVVTAVDDGVFHWNPDPEYRWAGYSADYLVYLHPNPNEGESS